MLAEVCPCGGDPAGAGYLACCGRWHQGPLQGQAPDAPRLMRSRYSAFDRQDAGYLLATWHISTRPASVEFGSGVQWLGLEIRQHQRIDDHHAVVEFVARCRGSDGRATRLHERSRFVRDDGRWFYIDGDLL